MRAPIRVAIDGNEANTPERVGSNVYAFEILSAMSQSVAERNINATILLSSPPIGDWPAETEHWKYELVTPARYWTQWAAPVYLKRHQKDFDCFFTPSHYAPRACPIPYISSVMDTAYLSYPHEFKLKDRIQLTDWTGYSVKGAAKVVAISRFTKRCVMQVYKRSDKDVLVAYPAVNPVLSKPTTTEKKQLLGVKGISSPYFLYIGTIQPRKRLTVVIEAFEALCTQLVAAKSRYRSKKESQVVLPQLVLAGRVGWLAAPIVQRVAQSSFKSHILLLGYVSEVEKQVLLAESKAVILIGRHEGFGIPPLEAMAAGSIPIVARTGSLPEVVGSAGLLVAADDSLQLTNKMKLVLEQTSRERSLWLAKGKSQSKRFSWSSSASVILDAIESIANV